MGSYFISKRQKLTLIIEVDAYYKKWRMIMNRYIKTLCAAIGATSIT